MTLEEEIDELIEKENNGVGSIDLFFDYMKTRTCENCKHYENTKFSSQKSCQIGVSPNYNNVYHKGFGCNKFERKEDVS